MFNYCYYMLGTQLVVGHRQHYRTVFIDKKGMNRKSQPAGSQALNLGIGVKQIAGRWQINSGGHAGSLRHSGHKFRA